jgi:hypothetical protein
MMARVVPHAWLELVVQDVFKKCALPESTECRRLFPEILKKHLKDKAARRFVWLLMEG